MLNDFEECIIERCSRFTEKKISMDKHIPESKANQPQTQVQGGQNQQQGKVDIPVETFMQLLQQYVAKTSKKTSVAKYSQKSPLVRAKSDPLHGSADPVSKRKSIPEIFIFPDLKENSSSYSETQEGSCISVSCDGRTANEKPDDSMSRSELGAQEGNKTGGEKPEMLPLSLSYEDKKASFCGVSEVYFKNVVNELIRTKKYVKDLQDQCKLLIQDRVENDKLKKEVHSLRFMAQQLKREHKILTDQNKKLKLKLKAYQPVGMNESFELESSDGSEFCERAVQTDSKMMGLQSDESYMQASMDELKKENVILNQHYSDLKDNVKILNSCLAEEKQKNRQKEKVLMEKEEQRKMLYSQLSQRRQEYDELRLGYNALKKELNLYEDDHLLYPRSQHSSRSSGTRTPYGSQTSSRMSSSEQILLNISPNSQSRPRHDSQGSGLSGGRVPFQNDLSSLDDEARAPSNIPLPFSRDYSDHTSFTASKQLPIIHGTKDSQPHDELLCPWCYQTFQEDCKYLEHLQKCDSILNC